MFTDPNVELRDIYDSFSVLDYRYWMEKLVPYLSGNAYIKYLLQVELAIVKIQAKYDMCSEAVVAEVEAAISQVRAAKVAEREKETRHDIIALVVEIQDLVSSEAKPYIHRFATSYDIIDTARAMMYRDLVNEVMIPELRKLMLTLISLARQEAATPQMGRTHLQHAIPVTYGFNLASTIARLGDCTESLAHLATKLRGKFSGPVGAYNSQALLLRRRGLEITSQEFEIQVLASLGLKPGLHSRQIVMPEPVERLLNEMVLISGSISNLAQDCRILQMTEVGEVAEHFEIGQGGSSAMSFKRNPIGHEGTLSLNKIVMPKMLTVLMDQISDLQRDLSNSASSRTYFEIPAYVTFMIERMNKIMSKIHIGRDRMLENMKLSYGVYAAEPLRSLLADTGLMSYSEAYKLTQQIAAQCTATRTRFQDAMQEHPVIRDCLELLDPDLRMMLLDETAYTGEAEQVTKAVCDYWEPRARGWITH
jgi:adenylosuccinate lyase